MNHLFRKWPEVAVRLRNSVRIALFLDFDGTLAPFSAKPANVRLPVPTRAVLRRLSRHPRLRIHIISGRRLEDLRRRTDVSGLRHLGLYGWENGHTLRLTRDERQAIEQVKTEIAARSIGLNDVWVEDKGLAFAVHFRDATPCVASQAAGLVKQMIEPRRDMLQAIPGDGVLEVLPRKWPGKGIAARRRWMASGAAALPVYIGDAAADEPAFVALAAGITISVGPGRSRAHFWLRGPAEVRAFLEKLEAEIHERSR